MHPTLDVLENVILKGKDLDIYRHIDAANFSGRIYADATLRRMWSMTPATQIYYSLLNPTFTVLQNDIEKRNLNYPVVMYRDGIIDFIQHMIDHSAPTQMNYIIEERLEPFVSEAWYQSGLFYRLYYAPATAYQLPVKRRRLVITTIVNGSFVAVDSLKQQLLLAKDFAKKHDLEIQVHLPVRENLFFEQSYREQPALFSLSDLLFRTLGTNLHFISDKKMMTDSDYRDAYYLIPSDGALCLADNTLEHQLLTRGAAPMLPKKPVAAGEFKVPFSTHHGVVISQKKRPKKCGELFNKLVTEAVRIKESSSIDIEAHQFPHFAKQLTYGAFFHYMRTMIE